MATKHFVLNLLVYHVLKQAKAIWLQLELDLNCLIEFIKSIYEYIDCQHPSSLLDANSRNRQLWLKFNTIREFDELHRHATHAEIGRD